jgi:hypothetical protein
VKQTPGVEIKPINMNLDKFLEEQEKNEALESIDKVENFGKKINDSFFFPSPVDYNNQREAHEIQLALNELNNPLPKYPEHDLSIKDAYYFNEPEILQPLIIKVDEECQFTKIGEKMGAGTQGTGADD